jgi:hypothetical protein
MAGQVKGAALLARGAFVRSEFGDDAWKLVVDGTSGEARRTLGGSILSSKWYPFAISHELDEAIVRTLGAGDRAIFKRIGARSARENLEGPHKSFLGSGDPAAFMERTSAIYRFYYDTGRREWLATGPTSGVMTTHDAETYSQADCLTVIGWYEEALAMCGARDVVIREPSCRATGADVCRYEVRWS